MTSLGLLNNSTTFIGTLTTIVVLCIISEGNFIHKILDEQKDAIKRNIDALKGKLIRPMVLESKEYKEFTKKIYNLSNQKDKLRAQILTSEIKSWIGKSDSNLLIETFNKAQVYIDRAHDSNEQFLSPHYCFLFCIVLFLCDELVVHAHSDVVSSWVIIFLVLFITYSFILLSALWIMYIRRFGIGRKTDYQMDYVVKEGKIHFNKKKAIAIGGWLLAIIVYFHFGRLRILINNDAIQWPCIIFIEVVDSVLLALPVCYIYAVHETAGNSVHKRLTYNFTSIHFIFGGILSLAVSAVVSILRLSMSPNFMYIPSCGFIKWGSIVFIILFGLVLPSCLPYAVFCRAEKNVVELLESKNQATNDKRRIFLEKIRNFNLRN